ncbi:hypothetical protein LUZ61_018531 [Rhynchospora tenuis]|uniref:RING-type E3 ubiquitin transferase n=1 Tax=Rhynchospora tenuis TaxID=198213 RepID=A0AAD5Z9H3_9POAL|nr:hypothetical protein LUZ61_018531 [Rhynchospora tenuis]
MSSSGSRIDIHVGINLFQTGLSSSFNLRLSAGLGDVWLETGTVLILLPPTGLPGLFISPSINARSFCSKPFILSPPLTFIRSQRSLTLSTLIPPPSIYLLRLLSHLNSQTTHIVLQGSLISLPPISSLFVSLPMEHSQLSPPTPVFTSPPPSSSTSILVLALSILGILTISLILLVYYLFVTKCFHILRHRSSTGTVSRRQQLFDQYDNHVMHTSRTAISGHGLNESTIQSIPTIFYKKHGHDKKLSFHECAVCINEFQEGEKIRLLPNCFHVFHLDCIDVWLQSNANCPLCRSAITACPMALANLVGPTSQEDANESNNDIVIEIRDDELHVSGFKPRGSMGDECIDIRRKEEDLGMVPMRRSFSMDSSNDRQLYLALQKIVREHSFACQEVAIDHESSSSGTSGVTGKLRRGFFSFNQNRCSRSAVLPI